MKDFFKRHYLFFSVWAIGVTLVMMLFGFLYIFNQYKVSELLWYIIDFIHALQRVILNFFNRNALMATILAFIGGVIIVAIEKNENIDAKKINKYLLHYIITSVISFILSIAYDMMFYSLGGVEYNTPIFDLYVILGAILILIYFSVLFIFTMKRTNIYHAIIICFISFVLII